MQNGFRLSDLAASFDNKRLPVFIRFPRSQEIIHFSFQVHPRNPPSLWFPCVFYTKHRRITNKKTHFMSEIRAVIQILHYIIYLIAELQNGIVPWQKPWSCSTGAISHITGKPYSVLNQLMLPLAGEYVTFKQALAEGHPVRKGEKSHMVFFFKIVENKDRDTGEITSVPFLRYYKPSKLLTISKMTGVLPSPTESARPICCL